MHAGVPALVRRPYGWQGSFTAMASPCEVHVACGEERLARQVVSSVEAEAHRVEEKFSRYRADSVVAAINDAGGGKIVVDEETARLLDYADELHRLSGGLFDITSGVLRRAWRFDGSDRLPSRAEVERAHRHVGWQRVVWNNPELTLEAGMEIDFGGIGKEYAVDRAAVAAQQIVPHSLLNFGGDLVATGSRISAHGWSVGIENPLEPSAPLATIKLTSGAVATSGDARRFLLNNGKRYGHILDPRTGWPVDGAPRSITVAATTCTYAGMLATLAMLRGAEAEAFLDGEGVRYWSVR